MTRPDPTLDVERRLLADASLVIGIDEVGRGALAGPVAVGAVAVDSVRVEDGFPTGLRDSKLLSEKRREALAEPCQRWGVAWGVGLSEPAEIAKIGITGALAAASARALDRVAAQFADAGRSGPVAVILDGSHDWLSRMLIASANPLLRSAHVIVQPKADRDCASVAAASVVAKVHRDALMREADALAPAYGWARNKGYASAAHAEAIREHGAHPLHREGWLRRILGEPSLIDAHDLDLSDHGR